MKINLIRGFWNWLKQWKRELFLKYIRLLRSLRMIWNHLRNGLKHIRKEFGKRCNILRIEKRSKKDSQCRVKLSLFNLNLFLLNQIWKEIIVQSFIMWHQQIKCLRNLHLIWTFQKPIKEELPLHLIWRMIVSLSTQVINQLRSIKTKILMQMIQLPLPTSKEKRQESIHLERYHPSLSHKFLQLWN